MKKTDREVYQVLLDQIGCGLCFWCKFAEWEGSLCSGDGYSECHHQLGERYEWDSDAEVSTGSDCWGFRNRDTVDKLAAIVGVVLENNLDEWAFVYSKSGNIHVQTLEKQFILPYGKVKESKNDK